MTKEEIGAILKSLRVKANMTQKEVAEQIGRKQQIIGHWETGYSQPDANTLFELCELYGSTVDEAFGFQKTEKSLSISEQDLLKKYRSLDIYGKNTVNCVIDCEIERLKESGISYKSESITDLSKLTVEEKVALYRRELEIEEKKAEEKSEVS